MNTCIIAIGSNIDPENNIAKMMNLLEKEVEVLQVSKMIKTKPIGIVNQDDFMNGAVKIETELDFLALNVLLKKIEGQLGRNRSAKKFGPRNIDLDILIFNNEIMDQDYYTRDFLRESAKELGFTAH